MELHNVEVVRTHAAQALLDGRADVLARVLVLPAGSSDRSAALGRDEELRAPSRDVAADELLAGTVVRRCVDVIDARIEDGVQDGLGLRVRHRSEATGIE